MFNPLKVAREAVEKYGALQKVGELAGFLALAVDHAPQVVLEIGSDHGGTLWAWQQLPSVRRVLAVDLPRGGFHSGRSLDAHGVEVVYGDSHKPETLAELADLLADDSVDLLFIDGDHTLEGVTSDYVMYSPLVRPGGVIGFHDILTHPGMPYVAVDVLWRQLRQPSSRTGSSGSMEEIVTDPPTWGGIGVLHVAAELAVTA